MTIFYVLTLSFGIFPNAHDCFPHRRLAPEGFHLEPFKFLLGVLEQKVIPDLAMKLVDDYNFGKRADVEHAVKDFGESLLIAKTINSVINNHNNGSDLAVLENYADLVAQHKKEIKRPKTIKSISSNDDDFIAEIRNKANDDTQQEEIESPVYYEAI